MSNRPNKFAVAGQYFEKPFLVKQVETHLIFGSLYRHFPFGWAIFVLGMFLTAYRLYETEKPATLYFFDIALALFMTLGIVFFFTKFSRLQQAIITWLSVKFALGVGAFMMITVGASYSFLRGRADAWPNLFLGLIWIPWIEFIPRITEK